MTTPLFLLRSVGTGDFHPGSGSAHDWAGSGYVDGEIQ